MNDVTADVTQQERNNNKCYASVFIYIILYGTVIPRPI